MLENHWKSKDAGLKSERWGSCEGYKIKVKNYNSFMLISIRFFYIVWSVVVILFDWTVRAIISRVRFPKEKRKRTPHEHPWGTRIVTAIALIQSCCHYFSIQRSYKTQTWQRIYLFMRYMSPDNRISYTLAYSCTRFKLREYNYTLLIQTQYKYQFARKQVYAKSRLQIYRWT